MTMQTFPDESPDLVQYAPDLRRLRAPNPSPMTERGTNTYLVGKTSLAVIDPGPDMPEHLDAIMAEIGAAQVEVILVTHSHRDHSCLAPNLSEQTGAPVLAFGDSLAGRSAFMASLANDVGGGEGVDTGFKPDRVLKDGDAIESTDWTIRALWTPGHMANHLCFQLQDIVFSGDLVMGWATSLVSPPDGDLTAFYGSCQKLAERHARVLLPGHGAAVSEPAGRITELVAHRENRTAQVMEALGDGPGTAPELAKRVYTDVPAALMPAAERNLLAHLIALMEAGKVSADAPLSARPRFARLARE